MSSSTPLERAPSALSEGKWDLWLKREDLHELGAFKWRGALPAVESFRRLGARSVVTASTGNHGAATAWAARRVGLSAVVYVPAEASRAKLLLLAAQGADVRSEGRDLDEAKDLGRAFAAREGFPFFEDGAEPAQEEGYAAITDEILAQCPRAPAAVVVPLGNGALLAGMGRRLKARSPATLLFGAAAREAPVMELSIRAGHPVECSLMATFADGLAVRVAIPRAVEGVREVVDGVRLVSERQIARAVGAYAGAGIRAEGAAAAALAALPSLPVPEGPIVLVVTGRNIDEGLWRRAVESPGDFPD